MDNYRQILQEYWGFPDFRGIQREIIESIGQGKDTLGLMPTGGGKSITFQVPALMQEGTCIVVTPLIALMKDQVMHLRKRGITAAAIHSGMAYDDIVKTLDNCIYNGIKLLYVSPERLSSDIFQKKVKNMKVSFITVDEAHCISQWGYDFRPAYLSIAMMRDLLPDAPILALTATATPQVVDDIQQQLRFRQNCVFRMSFERKNLSYITRLAYDKEKEMLHILQSLGGSTIVYVRSRKRSKEISDYLNKSGIAATYYHAGLDTAAKDQRQKDWQEDEVRVMVATNAFGMGIDKADVRMVLHMDCPDSLEAYFQEAGRAGRDGKKSYAVMLYNDNDIHKLRKRIADNFPEKDYIKDVYEHLAYHYQIGIGSGRGASFEFHIDQFCQTHRFYPTQVHAALKIIALAGYIHYDTDPDASSRVVFLLSRNELYKLENNSRQEDSVIVALLRNYGGLFTDYCHIDEALIAQQTGLDAHQVYVALKTLRQRNIIHFIPRRKTPLITYLQDREDGARIHIPKAVYEERKSRYKERVHAVIDYIMEEQVCRSRILLQYFGEERSSDCRQCDVCLSHKERSDDKQEAELAKQAILGLLKDGQPHHISELNHLSIPRKQLHLALSFLCCEEIVSIEDSYLRLS